MISKTIGFRGLAYFQTHPYDEDLTGKKKTSNIYHVLNRILTCSFAGKSSVSDRVWVIEGGTLSPVMFVGLASSINQRNYRT